MCGACEPPDTPWTASGMRLPRQNVPQYVGNGIWDGAGVIDAPRAIAAMLGDPFAFGRSPELDALAHVFEGKSTRELVAALEERWWVDGAYSLLDLSLTTRAQFMEGMRHLDAWYVLSHIESRRDALLSAHAPPELIERLSSTLRRVTSGYTSHVMAPEAALCAAVATMDLLFASRSALDVWTSSIADQRASEAGPSLFNDLYRHDTISAYEDDPHDAIYTTVYQSTASGWYGGNATAVFAPADDPGSSGVDIYHMRTRGCAGAPFRGESDEQMLRRWCTERTRPFSEESFNNGDAGEQRSPHYKAPGEVTGYLTYAPAEGWFKRWSHGQDLSLFARPLEWSFHRVRMSTGSEEHEGGSWQAEPTVLILANGAGEAAGTVYGIGEDRSAAEDATSSSARVLKPFGQGPPGLLGADAPLHEGGSFAAADLPWLDTARTLPAWGVLHRCEATSNVPPDGRPPSEPSEIRSEPMRARVCNAARVLRRHLLAMDTLARRAVEEAALPKSHASELRALRVWPAEGYVDLATSSGVRSPRIPDAVCVLSVAALAVVEARGICEPVVPPAPPAPPAVPPVHSSPPAPPTAPTQTWTMVQRTNCYDGRGAVNAAPYGSGRMSMPSVEACQAACARFGEQCTAVVVGWGPWASEGRLDCWIRSRVVLQECRTNDGGFTVYLRNGT